VVADLVGMSKSRLSQIERGERALDSLSEIVSLADVLEVAPSELIRLLARIPVIRAHGQHDRSGPTRIN
jgi:transcriptional regulator with XRE-family HTH domain